MIKVSNEFEELMQECTDFKPYAEVTFQDGRVIALDIGQFTPSNNSIVDGAGTSSFPLGIAVQKNIRIEILNDIEQYADFDFFGAKIRMCLEFQLSATKERIEKGTYTVISPETYGETIIITAYDDMYKADKDYSTTLTFPCSAGVMLRDICSTCGIVLGSTSFLHDDFMIQEKPTGTFRQVIGWIAMIAGGNARIDTRNKLQIVPYDFSGFETNDGYHTLSNWMSPKIEYNDSIISGFKTVIKGDTTEDDVEVLVGEGKYTITVENPLIINQEETVLTWLLENIGNVPFRPFSGDLVSNPLIEFMDLVKVKDRRGNLYDSFVTDVNFLLPGYTTVKNSSPCMEKAAVIYISEKLRVEKETRKLVEKEKSDRELAIESLNKTLSESSGMYSTKEGLEDGSTIYYLHDKPTIAESKNVMKLTAEAIGFSLDGGKTYPFGFTIDGETVMRIIESEGVNAGWINTGRLVAKDRDGNVMFLVDIDTGEVEMNAKSIRLGSSSVVTEDNLEVGGRNILRGTAAPTLLSSSSMAYWTDGVFRYGSSGDGLGSIEDVSDSPVPSVSRAFVMKNNTAKNRDFQQGAIPIVDGQTYTFNVWAKGTGKLLFRFWYSGTESQQVIFNQSVEFTEWTRVSGTVTADMPDGTTKTAMMFGITGACDEMMFIAPKLEKGNVATDWIPAPEDTASDIDNALAVAEAAQNALNVSLDVIVGTQTAATGAWTGKAKFSELTDGQQIVYWLPYAGSGNATLNLTLSDGTTTGAKNCYYGGTTRLATHYPAGSAIRLIYRAAAQINGNTYEGWWADANYDTGNTYDRTRYKQPIKCGTTAIVAGNVIVGKDGVYQHLKSGASFDISYQILYAGSAIAASATGTNNYVAVPFTVTTTQSITLTAYKPVYIKGKLSGTMFTPISTAPLTQTVPTSDDSYHYILLGQAYSTTGIYLLPEHPIFMYHNGTFKSFEQIAAEAAAAAEKAQNDIDNLEIGGRNLLQDTDAPSVTKVHAGYNRYWSNAAYTDVWTSRTIVEMPDSPCGCKYGARMVCTGGSGTTNRVSSLAFYSSGHVALKAGTYTVSAYVRLTEGDETYCRGGVTDVNAGKTLLSGSYSTHVTSEWQRHEWTFTLDSDYDNLIIYPCLVATYYGGKEYAFTAEVCGFKLEKGNRATDWTPAPEDVQGEIDNVQQNVNNLTKTVFSASTPTDTSVLWIDTSQSPPVAKRYNPDTVAWEVVNDTTEILNSIREDVKSVINQLPDQIDMSVKSQTYLKGEVDTLVNEVKSMLTQTDNELAITLSELRGSIEDVDGKIDASLKNYETYFKFRSTGMYIGKNDSTIKLRLSNDRLSFTENDVEVAYISDRKMYITELEVIGNILWDGWGFTHESNESRSFGKIR